MRRSLLGGVLGAVVALATAPSALAIIVPPLPKCTGVVTTKCVVSVQRDGVEITYPTAGGDTYQVSAGTWVEAGTRQYHFTISRTTGGPFTLEPDVPWSITLNTGAMYPEETFARGKEVTVTRGGSASAHTVTLTMKPVRMATTNDACGHAGTCGGPTSVAPNLWTGYLDGWVDDLGYISDPDDAAAMRGFDLATNADWVSTPLQLDYETHAIILDVANRHFEPGGTVPFVGSAEFRVPFAMLNRLYEVDDPSSLTASAFSITAPGASASTAVTVGATDVHVAINGITFTRRRLRIHGDMTPRAVTNLRARRTSSSTALLGFTRARPRGSKVRGYKATCRAGTHTVTASSSRNRSPLRVSGLYYGTRYACTLRAKSHAGPGKIARISIPRF
jgi:Fibronectin type III domain